MAQLILASDELEEVVHRHAHASGRATEPASTTEPAERSVQTFRPARTEGGWRWVYLAPIFVADAVAEYLRCVAGEVRRSRHEIDSITADPT